MMAKKFFEDSCGHWFLIVILYHYNFNPKKGNTHEKSI